MIKLWSHFSQFNTAMSTTQHCFLVSHSQYSTSIHISVPPELLIQIINIVYKCYILIVDEEAYREVFILFSFLIKICVY